MIESAEVEFSQAEANMLLGLLHEATLALGLKVAKNVVYFQNKFEAAFSAPKEEVADQEQKEVVQ